MGEAKKRGSAEDRKAFAKTEEHAKLEKMAEQVNLPVDEDLFLYCSNLYSAAASLAMPVENPEEKKIHIKDRGTFGFKDIPMNRGMLAITKELREQGIPENIRFSLGIRIMHFGQVLEARDRFRQWIRPRDEDDSIDVAEALIRACALARFNLTDDDLVFDLDDIGLHASAIEKRLDSEDSVSTTSGTGALPIAHKIGEIE